jgi:hypothetical protein
MNELSTHSKAMGDTQEAEEAEVEGSAQDSKPQRPRLVPPAGVLSFDDLEAGGLEYNPIDQFVIGIYLDIAANGDTDEIRLKAAEALGRGRGHDAKAEVRAGKYKFGQPQALQQNNFVFAQEATLRQLMEGIKALGLGGSADPTPVPERLVSAEGAQSE